MSFAGCIAVNAADRPVTRLDRLEKAAANSIDLVHHLFRQRARAFMGSIALFMRGEHSLLGRRTRRGFTLLEALMANGILLVVVVAVTSAITAGQQNAYEAHQRIAASLAAEEMMGRLITDSYANLPSWNGYTEAVGKMTDVQGKPMPGSFGMVGRDVQVTTGLRTINEVSVTVQGRTVQVRAFNRHNRTLTQLTRFIPEPQS